MVVSWNLGCIIKGQNRIDSELESEKKPKNKQNGIKPKTKKLDQRTRYSKTDFRPQYRASSQLSKPETLPNIGLVMDMLCFFRRGRSSPQRCER